MLEPLDIINKLRVEAFSDHFHPRSRGLNALSWQILYQVTEYLENPSRLKDLRDAFAGGKSLAMNHRRISRYLKHYGKLSS